MSESFHSVLYNYVSIAVVSRQTWSTLWGGGGFVLILVLSVSWCCSLSHPLSSLSLRGGADENPADHGRPRLFPPPTPPTPRPSPTTLAAPWYHDWPPQSALISHIDSCQSIVWAGLWQAEALMDGRNLCVLTWINSKFGIVKYHRLLWFKFVVNRTYIERSIERLWGSTLFKDVCSIKNEKDLLS